LKLFLERAFMEIALHSPEDWEAKIPITINRKFPAKKSQPIKNIVDKNQIKK
jgi:predicted secreted protein